MQPVMVDPVELEAHAGESQWFFTVDALFNTPSLQISSMPLSEELHDRSTGIEFLFRLGSSLQLPASALFTAATWYHRFYMRYSIEDFHRQDVAVACIFLSTKTEECGRKLRDVAKVYKSKIIGCSSEQISDADAEKCQEDILATEEVLLQALCFDFTVVSPHEALVDLFSTHVQNENEDSLKDVAWCIAHDSYRTPLCLLFDVRIIAAACFILAQRFIEGENSPSLGARIGSSPPSASLPTPPSNKPTSPDATRFVIDQYQFNEAERADLAEALTILLEFYGAQDTSDSSDFLQEITRIQPPATPDTRRRLYPAYVPSAELSATDSQNAKTNLRTPDSTHDVNSPAKASPNQIPANGETGNPDIALSAGLTRLDP